MEERTVEGGRILLVTLEYDAQDMNGPPFSSTEDEIRALYGNGFVVENLSRDSIFEKETHWKKKGLSSISDAVYLLTRKTSSDCKSGGTIASSRL
jgi:thiopurine S-methyltransferase